MYYVVFHIRALMDLNFFLFGEMCMTRMKEIAVNVLRLIPPCIRRMESEDYFKDSPFL